MPNAHGDLPLVDKDPTRPVEAYFKHVDYVVDRAEELGLVVGMLPTWGSWWHDGKGIFTPETAESYGEFLGRRYKDKPILWILGGDRPVEDDRQKAIIRAMAAGLRKGDGGRHLMTFHPPGGRGSAEWFHGDDWLAFDMIQTGHGHDHTNYDRIAADYARKPAKPCIDGEPGYEDHPAEFDPKNGYLDEYDARKFAYWSLFAGACGHTYGCHDIWQFSDRADRRSRRPGRPGGGMGLPGADQMRHAQGAARVPPRPDPNPRPIAAGVGPRPGHRPHPGDRADDGSYALVYSASGRPFTLDLGKLSGERLRASWYDPRDGTSKEIGTFRPWGQEGVPAPLAGQGARLGAGAGRRTTGLSRNPARRNDTTPSEAA